MSTPTHTGRHAVPSPRERRLARRVRLGVAALVVASATGELFGGAWPLLLWPMYARVHPAPPARVAEYEIRWVDRQGRETTVLPTELYTHVHAELGRRVVAAAVSTAPDRDAYRRVIERRMRSAFGAHAPAAVRVRRLEWRVAARAVPPFRACCPDAVEIVAAWTADGAEPTP